MKIESIIKWSGINYPVKYKDLNTFDRVKEYNQIYGICFVGNKIVICYNKSLRFWVLPGGTPEEGETIEQALAREIMEEAGLRLISYKPIGVQEVFGDGKVRKQLRAVCVCEKVAEHNDPCDDISEVKLVDIGEIEKYITWGEIGNHIFKRSKILRDDL